MKLDWYRYPAGADILLFDGALHICVATAGKGYAAVIHPGITAGGGALYIGEGSKTIDEAIDAAEAWLAKHIESGLPPTKRVDDHLVRRDR